MNALQLVNEVLSRFGEKEVTAFSDTEEAQLILRKVNLAIYEITTAHPFLWAQNQDPRLIPAIEGQSTYRLFTDVAHVLIIKHQYNGGGVIKPIDRATLEEYRSDRSQTTDYGTPKYFTTSGVYQETSDALVMPRIEVWPLPDSNFANQYMYYYYTRTPTELSYVTDVPFIPLDYHWLIVEKAESLYRRGPIRVGGDGLQSQIDLFSIAEAKYEKGLANLISRDSALSSSEFSWQLDAPSL